MRKYVVKDKHGNNVYPPVFNNSDDAKFAVMYKFTKTWEELAQLGYTCVEVNTDTDTALTHKTN